MIRVGIDVSPLRQTAAGTARYLRGLLPHLEREPDLELCRLAWGGEGRLAAAVRDTCWYLAALPVSARRLNVLHCPTFRAPVRARAPVVVTVHDLAVLRFPEVFRRWSRTYGRLLVPRVVRAAARVVAVSDFTRRELVELLGVDERRIRVVPNAVADVFRPDGPAAAGDYVIAVGTLEPRKNLERTAAAARRLGLELRVAGAPGWGGVGGRLDGVRWLGRPSDDELAAALRGASCLVYPSLYEGFGIPVLEAMACGTPVVTSRGTASEEVAGGAAVLVEPRDVESIAAGIEDALARREELRRLGLERARAFSWAASARATADVYREVA